MGSETVGPEFRRGIHVAEIVKTEIRYERNRLVLAWFRIENSTAVVRLRIHLTPNNPIAENKLRALLLHGGAVADTDAVTEKVLESMIGARLRVAVKFWTAPDGKEIPVVDFVLGLGKQR